MLGLAGLLSSEGALAAPDSASAPAGRWRPSAALCAQGAASGSPVHERRAVAGRYVRSQADARQVPRPAASLSESAHRAQDRRGHAVAVQVSKVRPKRHRGQRAVRQDGPAHRRHVRHPLDGGRGAQSRAVAAVDELRRRAAAAPQLRLLGHLRTGVGEPEPARLHRHVPRRLSDRRHAELAFGLSARRVPGHVHRHQAHRDRQADREHPERALAPAESAAAARLRAAAQPAAPGSPAERDAAAGSPHSNRSSWPTACRPKRPTRSTSIASPSTFASSTATDCTAGNC